MDKKYCVLPCNGLDKPLGQITRETALLLYEKLNLEIICPVLLNNDPVKFKDTFFDNNLIVIDGCMTRCASKIAANNGLSISKKVFIPDEIKKTGLAPDKTLRISENTIKITELIYKDIEALIKMEDDIPTESAPKTTVLDEKIEFKIHTHDKYIFRFPESGFLFSENDFWVRHISKDTARIGLSDFMQQYLSDIMFVELPAVGKEFEQFDEIAGIESTKSVYQLISPVSGIVTAINKDVEETPELINESPYEKGWMLEIKLTNFDEDRELLLKCEEYMERTIKKINLEFKK